MSRDALVVCLCVEDLGACDVVIQEVASGGVFGATQPLQLVLCGPNHLQLEGLRMDIEDCLYPLIQACRVVRHVSELQHPPHVAMVILATRDRRSHMSHDQLSHMSHDQLSGLLEFVAACGGALGPSVDATKIIVVGTHSLTAASLLAQYLSGDMAASQMVAVDDCLPRLQADQRPYKPAQYSLVAKMFSTVSQWWAGPQNGISPKIKLGTKFTAPGQRSASYFLPAPCDIRAPGEFNVIGSTLPVRLATQLVAQQDKALLKSGLDKQERASLALLGARM